MTDSTRARVKDVLTIGTLSIALVSALGASAIKVLGLQTKDASAKELQAVRTEFHGELDELRDLILDARQWAWCDMNGLTPEQCRAAVPPSSR